jgi:hypothetical protein
MEPASLICGALPIPISRNWVVEWVFPNQSSMNAEHHHDEHANRKGKHDYLKEARFVVTGRVGPVGTQTRSRWQGQRNGRPPPRLVDAT